MQYILVPLSLAFTDHFSLGTFRLEAVANLEHFNQGRSNKGGFVPGYFTQSLERPLARQVPPFLKKDLNTGEPLTAHCPPIERPAVVVHLLL